MTENLPLLNGDSRLKIRQLVKDTFKSITLNVSNKYDENLEGIEKLIAEELLIGNQKNYFDLTLEFHNGKKRLLRIDKHSGELLVGHDFSKQE